MRHFIFILLAVFFVSGFVLAQDETDACFYETEDEEYYELGDLDFGDCAELLLEWGYYYEYYEAYGYWGDYYVYVGEEGDTYYWDEETEDWIYWADVNVPDDDSSIEDDGSAEDNSDSETTSTGNLSLDEVFDLAEFDINAFWERQFDEWDYRYEEPDVVMDYGAMESACGDFGDIGPFYCGADNTVYLELYFMEDQYSRIGDYAVVIIVAHEWGHAIEQQLGYLDGNYYSITTELMADCLAGAYTNYLTNESENAVIENGDIDEAMTSLFEVGDSEDTPWFDETAHGTGEQRQDSFQVGVEFGAEQCFEVEQ